jgi:hypothetical protein
MTDLCTKFCGTLRGISFYSFPEFSHYIMHYIGLYVVTSLNIVIAGSRLLTRKHPLCPKKRQKALIQPFMMS